MDNPFEELLSFSDAAKMWKLDDSTLRKAAANGKFVDGVEVKKIWKTMDNYQIGYDESLWGTA